MRNKINIKQQNISTIEQLIFNKIKTRIAGTIDADLLKNFKQKFQKKGVKIYYSQILFMINLSFYHQYT